jgi:hypothetical protein
MAKTKSKSVRIEDALWKKFCALEGTQNEVFRRLLEQCEAARSGPDLLQKTYERTGRIENMVEELLGLGTSAVPGTVSGEMGELSPDAPAVRAVASLPANCGCKHCGERFHSGNKFATICSECKAVGHTGDPRECPPCLDRGTGGL